MSTNDPHISELGGTPHHDYRAPGSYPRTITITSSGGLPPGIDSKNILWKQEPHNRRIAEVFSKCGLVERAGQDADTIFQNWIRQGKPPPNFSRTDNYAVVLTLDGQIQDASFLRFLEKLGQEV